MKRRREVWRNKVIKNEGSLANEAMNRHVAGKDPEGVPEKMEG